MSAVARGNGTDSVFSMTGTGVFCLAPITTATNECSAKVFSDNIGVVRIGDVVMPHPFAGCGVDGSTLSKASTKVFIENRGAGRIGDEYTPDNTITSGSSKVFFG